MPEISLDEELLEWASPVLQEFLAPSTILAHLVTVTYLSLDQVNEIREAERCQGTVAATRIMVSYLQAEARHSVSTTTGTQNAPIFTALVHILRQKGYEFLDRLLRNPQYIIDRNRYKRLLEIYLPNMGRIDMKDFMADLLSVGLFSNGTQECARVMAAAERDGDQMAALEMLNYVWRNKQNWFKRFLHALREHKNRGGAVDEDMLDTMENLYMGGSANGINKHIQCTGNDSVCADGAPLSFGQVVEGEADKEVLACRESPDNTNGHVINNLNCTYKSTTQYTKNFEELNSDSEENAATSPFTRQSSHGMKLKLQPYEQELVEPALNAKNVLIVAPSGSEMTNLAVHIALDHLERQMAKFEHRILFFVPTHDLVEERSETFQRYLPTKYLVLAASGETSKGSLMTQLNYANMVVLTPKLYLDSLNAEKPFSVFTMLFFDEYHHHNKDDTYTQMIAEIMSYYMEAKLDRKQMSLPQVIGLTTSEKLGKSKDRKRMKRHLFSLAAKLDATKIQTVVHNVDDLMKNMKMPDQGIIFIQGRIDDPFSKHINKLMQEIEKKMQMIAVSHQVAYSEGSQFFLPPDERDHQPYTQWLIKVFKEITTIVTQLIRRQLMSCFEYLNIFHNALILNKDGLTKDALEYMKKKMTFKVENFDNNEKNLYDLYLEYELQLTEDFRRDASPNNPKLEQLAEILSRERTHSEFRTIIFARTRAMTIALTEWMKSFPTLDALNPNYLREVGDDAGSAGFVIQLEEQVEAFKNGKCKILVATDGEEIADFLYCNLAIRYEHVGIKGRGYARLFADKTIFITENEKEAKREQINLVKEEMMHDLIKEINDKLKRDSSLFEDDQSLAGAKSISITEDEKEANRIHLADEDVMHDLMKKINDRLKQDDSSDSKENQHVREEQRKIRAQNNIKSKKKMKRRSQCAFEQKNQKSEITLGDVERVDIYEFYCAHCDDFAFNSTNIRKNDSSCVIVISNDFHERYRVHSGAGSMAATGGMQNIYCKTCSFNKTWGFKDSLGIPVVFPNEFLLKRREVQLGCFQQWKAMPFEIPEMTADDWENLAEEMVENGQ